MTTKGDDGVPLRVHLQKLAEGWADTPDRSYALSRLAEEKPLPPSVRDVWAFFLELHLRRHISEIGPVRFLWSELQAYSRETGVRMSKWQRRTIFAIEDKFFEIRAEYAAKTKKTKPDDDNQTVKER